MHPTLKAFDFKKWIETNRGSLNPPVGNKQLFDQDTGMVVMIVGGPNIRADFHDDPVEEFFYQLEGDMLLKINDNGQVYDVPIRQGEVFFLPPHIRHSPQRPVPGSVGLVVEGTRHEEDTDGFEWYCFNCNYKIHRVDVKITDIVKDLPPLFNNFYADETRRICPQCGTVHPGKQPPPGWVQLADTPAG